jgi:hypothetical protein
MGKTLRVNVPQIGGSPSPCALAFPSRRPAARSGARRAVLLKDSRTTARRGGASRLAFLTSTDFYLAMLPPNLALSPRHQSVGECRFGSRMSRRAVNCRVLADPVLGVEGWTVGCGGAFAHSPSPVYRGPSAPLLYVMAELRITHRATARRWCSDQGLRYHIFAQSCSSVHSLTVVHCAHWSCRVYRGLSSGQRSDSITINY